MVSEAYFNREDSEKLPNADKAMAKRCTTIKDMYKVDSRYLIQIMTAQDKLLSKLAAASLGTYFTLDCSAAPDNLFVRCDDRKKVIVDVPRISRSNRLVRKHFKLHNGKYQKHLKNKALPGIQRSARLETGGVPDQSFHGRTKDKGHNSACIIRGPLIKFIRLVENTFCFEGTMVLESMPLMRRGFCKKLALQHLVNLYTRVNHLGHPDSNQHMVMDVVLKECFDGETAADKLYVKLPVDEKDKEIDLEKITHEPMKRLMTRISREVKSKTNTKKVVNVYSSILNGECTKPEYLEAIPITDVCRKELMNYFDPPEDNAKMKMPMAEALRTGMITRPLTTTELARIARPDFESSRYRVFSANCLTQPNMDTNLDLKRVHIPGTEDSASREMLTLKDPAIKRQMDEELTHIKGLWEQSNIIILRRNANAFKT